MECGKRGVGVHVQRVRCGSWGVEILGCEIRFGFVDVGHNYCKGLTWINIYHFVRKNFPCVEDVRDCLPTGDTLPNPRG